MKEWRSLSKTAKVIWRIVCIAAACAFLWQAFSISYYCNQTRVLNRQAVVEFERIDAIQAATANMPPKDSPEALYPELSQIEIEDIGSPDAQIRELCWWKYKDDPAYTDDLVNRLEKLLLSENEGIREDAAWWLGELGPAAITTMPALVALLDDEDLDVRVTAAISMTEIDPENATCAVDPMLEILRMEDTSFCYPYIRCNAMWVLGRIDTGSDIVVNEIAGFLDRHRHSWRHSEAAARTLGDIGPGAKQAVPDLLKALESDSPQVVIESAKALLKINPALSEDAVSAIVSVFEEFDTPQSTVALNELVALGPVAEPAIPALEQGIESLKAMDDLYCRDYLLSATAEALALIRDACGQS